MNYSLLLARNTEVFLSKNSLTLSLITSKLSKKLFAWLQHSEFCSWKIFQYLRCSNWKIKSISKFYFAIKQKIQIGAKK